MAVICTVVGSACTVPFCEWNFLRPNLLPDLAAQMDGPGTHYIRRSYRKQAARVAAGAHTNLDRSDGGAVSQVRRSSVLHGWSLHWAACTAALCHMSGLLEAILCCRAHC